MKKTNNALLCVLALLLCYSTQAQWNLTGNANATATSILGTTNAIPLNLTTNNVNRLVIDANGKVGIGIATPVNILTVKGSGGTPAAAWVNSGAPLFAGFGEQATGNADYILSMASSLAGGRPVFIGRRSKGTLAAPLTVANNDYLMSFLASGYDGTSFQNPAGIDFYVDGTPAAGSVPTRISFVTGSNSTTRAERLKIGNTGNFTFNTNQLYIESATGNIGVGKNTGIAAKVDVNGIIKIGTQGVNPINGMIQYTGTDFQGYHNGWKSLTTGTSYTAGSGISIASNVISTIPQALSRVDDTLFLSGGGGRVTLPSSGGGGSGYWSIDGSNNIFNNNTGKVLIASATGTSGAKIEAVHDAVFGTLMNISNTNAAYMTILKVQEKGTSGGPAGCLTCGGSAAIRASANYGDAIFASSNSRGMYLKGGSSFYPAMQIDTNGTATALVLNGQLQINAGSPGAGKVLTSDASGLASWQPAGSGGNNVWSTTGNSGLNNNNFIGTTDATDLILKANNYEALRIYNGGAMVASGDYNVGVTPVAGPGVRMMWVPGKSAFRSGTILGTQWDNANIGTYSVAMGYNPIASGFNAVALGTNIAASGNYSFALGNDVSTNSLTGSFCLGDNNNNVIMNASAANQMNMRFQGGYRLFSTSAATIGAVIAPGGNSWASVSDRRRKENLAAVNGEAVLNSIAKFNLTSWNYIGQDAKSFRHYGPMAQDFFAAFGKDEYGTIGNDTTIASADFDGINLIAIQALEKRTVAIQNTLSKNNEVIKAKDELLQKQSMRIDDLQKEMADLKAMMQQLLNSKSTAPCPPLAGQ